MPSRASTTFDTEDDSDFESMQNAMAENSPPAKRTHSTMARDNDDDDSSDHERGPAPAPSTVFVNQNLVVGARHHAEKKRLRVDQITEVELFVKASHAYTRYSSTSPVSAAKDPPSMQNVKLFINMLALGNQIKKSNDSKPAFEVSPALTVNIRKYAPAVLLSSKTSVYKGDTATDILITILKNYRVEFDIPSGLENIPADWAKLVAEVREALTQRRSTIKKALDASLKINKTDQTRAPDDQHSNIFQLTETIVKNTQCSVNVVLCARVALMRKIYLKHPGATFWDKLDGRLAKIRKDAGGDAKKITV